MPSAYLFDYSPVRPIAFIVGMSRSGTTWMVHAINRQTNAAAFGETGFWGKHYLGGRSSVYGPDPYDSSSSQCGGQSLAIRREFRENR